MEDKLHISAVDTLEGPDDYLIDGLVRAAFQYALTRGVHEAVFGVPERQRPALERMQFIPPAELDIEVFFSGHRNCEKNIE